MRTLEDPGTGLWQRQGEPQDRSIHAIPDTPSHSTEQLSSFQGALKLREQSNKCLKTNKCQKDIKQMGFVSLRTSITPFKMLRFWRDWFAFGVLSFWCSNFAESCLRRSISRNPTWISWEISVMLCHTFRMFSLSVVHKNKELLCFSVLLKLA